MQRRFSWAALLLLGASRVAALSTPSAVQKRATTPYSNRIKLDQILLESENPSPNFPRTWVPLAAIDHLDPDRPSPLHFLGAKYVCYQDNSGNWVVLDDACPHRMVSDGLFESKSYKQQVVSRIA